MVAIAHTSSDRLALAVERFGRAKPDRPEIVRLGYTPGWRDITREGHCEQLCYLIAPALRFLSCHYGHLSDISHAIKSSASDSPKAGPAASARCSAHNPH
jgi:hypothetical protein